MARPARGPHDEGVSEPGSPSSSLAERLSSARTVLVFGEIDAKLSERVCGEILALDAASPDPIRVVVSSPGGHVESGDAIHDVIRFVSAPVHVVGSGWVASAGALIYVSVPRPRRYALPNTRFMLHQPSGGAGGVAADIAIAARQIVATRERLERIFAEATGRTLEQICEDTRRDHWMTATEALEYGLVGSIVDSAAAIERSG